MLMSFFRKRKTHSFGYSHTSFFLSLKKQNIFSRMVQLLFPRLHIAIISSLLLVITSVVLTLCRFSVMSRKRSTSCLRLCNAGRS